VLPQRCLLALVLQNLVSEEYLPQAIGKGAKPRVSPHVKADVEAAKMVGRHVLRYSKLTDREAEAIVKAAGVGWDQAGAQLVDISRLNLPGADLMDRVEPVVR
jgi:hypothetical protein